MLTLVTELTGTLIKGPAINGIISHEHQIHVSRTADRYIDGEPFITFNIPGFDENTVQVCGRTKIRDSNGNTLRFKLNKQPGSYTVQLQAFYNGRFIGSGVVNV